MRLTFRNGVEIDDPVRSALAFLGNDYSYRSYDSRIVEQNASVSLDDIGLANRIGARMSAAESEALYDRRDVFKSGSYRLESEECGQALRQRDPIAETRVRGSGNGCETTRRR